MSIEDQIKKLHSPFPIEYYHKFTAEIDYQQTLHTHKVGVELLPYDISEDIERQINRSKKVKEIIEQNLALALISDITYIRAFAEIIIREKSRS